jgi:hypothetical protein
MTTAGLIMASAIGIVQISCFALAWGFAPPLIAKSKGRGNFWAWYAYGFFLFPIALVHSLLLKSDQTAMDEKALPKQVP